MVKRFESDSGKILHGSAAFSRRSRRVIVNIDAKLIMGDRTFASFIENLSEEGAYVTTAPSKSNLDFAPETPVTLIFRFPAGDEIELQGKIKWSYITPPHGYTNSIGLEIINPPSTFKETLKTLQ